MSSKDIPIIPHTSHVDPHSLPFHPLPKDPPTCKVDLLHTGYIHSTRHLWVDEAYDQDEKRREAKMQEKMSLPIFCAALTNGKGQVWMWDLGMPNVSEEEKPRMPEIFKDLPESVFGTCELPQEAQSYEMVQKVKKVELDDVKGLILSHAHLDHYGRIDAFPEHIPVYWGKGNHDWIKGGHKDEGGLASFPTQYLEQDREFFELGGEGTEDIKKVSIGPWEEGWDIFGDGSAFVVKAEGHCPGHLGLLVHTGSNDWVFLAGDCGHSQSLYWPPPPQPYSHDTDRRSVPSLFKFSESDKEWSCMQTFQPEAFRTLASLTRMESEDNIMVVLAHEDELRRVAHLSPGDHLDLSHWQDEGLKEAKQEGEYHTRLARSEL